MGKIVVPKGMIEAANAAISVEHPSTWRILQAALQWLSENPVVPSDEQLCNISDKLPVKMAKIVWSERDRALIAEWQRQMFLAPEPEAIKNLLVDNQAHISVSSDAFNAAVLEAYHRGQKAGA